MPRQKPCRFDVLARTKLTARKTLPGQRLTSGGMAAYILRGKEWRVTKRKCVYTKDGKNWKKLGVPTGVVTSYYEDATKTWFCSAVIGKKCYDLEERYLNLDETSDHLTALLKNVDVNSKLRASTLLL